MTRAAQSVVYRYPLGYGITMDTGPLPCPRCRSANVEHTSHPATGSMATCRACGARSHLNEWNDGRVDLDRIKGRTTYKYCGLTFPRPTSDVVKRVSRAYVQRMRKGER